MNLIDAPASPTTAPGRPRPTSAQAARLTVLLPVATAVAITAVLVASSSLDETLADLGSTLGFLVWNLLPAAGAAALLLWAGRRGWLPYAAATFSCVTLAGLTAWALSDFWTSDSSTAALMFIFLPLSEWVVVLVGIGLVAIAAARVRRQGR